MGNDEQETGGGIAFGADAPTEKVTSADAMTTFLENGALLVIAALVVAVFLIYQFGRWYLANAGGSLQEDPSVLRDRPKNAVPAAQMPSEGNRRPWSSKTDEAAD